MVDLWNESFQWVHSNGSVHTVVERSSWFFIFKIYLAPRSPCGCHIDIRKFKWMNETPYQHTPVYRPPTNTPLTDHLPPPPTDYLPTTYQPLTDHLPPTYQPPTDHLPTTYQPPTDHFFTVQLVQNYRVNNFSHPISYKMVLIKISCTPLTTAVTVPLSTLSW